MTETSKAMDVLRNAESLFAKNPDWVTFFRRILGVDGVVRQTYRTQESLAEFEQSEPYARIQQMLARLREQQSDATSFQEDTKVITVRLPKSLHEALREESYQYHTSVNRLCISKLLQCIAPELVPPERYKRAASSASRAETEETEAGL